MDTETRKLLMDLNKKVLDLLWEISDAGKDCPESIRLKAVEVDSLVQDMRLILSPWK